MKTDKRFFDELDWLDSVIAGPASASALRMLWGRVGTDDILAGYALSRMRDPAWLGAFDETGGLWERLRERRGLGYSAASMLSRMLEAGGADSEEAVLAAMMASQGHVEEMEQAKLAESAERLRPELAARWAMGMADWLATRNRISDLLGIQLARLIGHLAQSKEYDASLRLMSVALEVMPDPEAAAKREEKVDSIWARRTPRPVTRVEKYSYDEILAKAMPFLLCGAARAIFDLLSRLVEDLIRYSLEDPEKEKPNDLSGISRPAIEDHEQNHDVEFDYRLISAWRDAAECIATQGPEAFRNLTVELEARGWNLFRRLAVHLIRVSPVVPDELATEWIASKGLLFDSGVQHEFFHLLRARFGQLPAAARNRVLAAIEGGEDLDGRDDLDAARRERRRRYGQYRVLLAIDKELDGVWQDRLKELRGEFGEPHMPPDFLSWVGPMKWSEPRSPIVEDEIASMPTDELVRRLREWQPSGDQEVATPDGLGSSISGVIASAPKRWAAGLKHFEDEALDPTYHRHIVSAFCRLAQEGKSFPYAEVFAFCRWVVRLPREIPGRVVEDGRRRLFVRDENRRPVRLEVARLVDRTLERTKKLDPALSSVIWEIIEPLTRDPDPTLERERETLSNRSWGALTESLNTVRGVALHCTMRFLWWCRTGEPEGRKEGLSRYPAVRAVLEEHLVGSGKAESQTDLAVLGQWLPYVISVDRDWVVANLRRVFPDEPERRSLCEAAWDSFVCYGKLIPSDYDVLKDVYLARARELRGVEFSPETPRGREVRFAEHMVWLYAWEKVTLERGDLVAVFFKNAPAELAGKAMAMAHHVFDPQSGTPDPVIERFRALWEWRMTQYGSLAEMPKPELAAFGWWFASGRFNAAWSFPILQEAIRLTNLDRSGHWVLKQMLAVFDQYPAETLNCLEAMIHKPEDRFQLHPMPDSPPWMILEKGLAHPDPAIHTKAEDLTHLLGSQGYLGYRELLRAAGRAPGEEKKDWGGLP